MEPTMENLQEIHKKCYKIFRQGFFEFPDEQENEDTKYFGPSNACKIYDKLTEGDDSLQDCIGENFNQLIQLLDEEWFHNYKPGNNLDYYFYNYFLLLYLFVERVDLIFNIINKDGKSKLFNDYHYNNFKTLRIINKWANFIKHPKEFLFTHWPHFYIKNEEEILLKEGDVKIDTEFIFKHYFSESNERPVILENHNNVYVEVPCLEKITIEFCKEMNVFFNFICCNQVVADFLKKKSTIENYYEFDRENDLNVISKDN